ncbi:MAG: 30S ribosomal protein S11 [Clostridia bacterium]|nr:30S ribosomal protein S11 [Clostridia bacterium]
MAEKVKRRRSAGNVVEGQVHIHTTRNNTIVTVTDMKGNVISWCSGGKLGYKGSRKESGYVAQEACSRAIEDAKLRGIKKVEIYVKGMGNGRETPVRAVQASGLEITMIKDVSPIPHNGCRPPKRRRL